MSEKKTIRLTEFSHGAGCGCKISPSILHDILKDSKYPSIDANLLVGNEEKDDAAVLDIGGGNALISTTDFFMPIVDDPFDFGRIAAVNSISDIYAMGGKPLLAISVLAWPVDKLGAEIAKEVIEGARSVCKKIGIALAGGHSIDNQEPVFGLAVNGIIKKENIKRNSNAKVGATLFLTKEIGVGIITTAKKKQLVSDSDYKHAVDSMLKLNSLGEKLSELTYVQAMTDVTGFGLLGHLIEICEGSSVSAEINFKEVPLMPNLNRYIELSAVPGGTTRNWKSYGGKVAGIGEEKKSILCDPQTSGGLLIAVEPGKEGEFLKICGAEDSYPVEIGKVIGQTDYCVTVI